MDATKPIKMIKYNDVMKKKKLKALKHSIILRIAPTVSNTQAKMFKTLTQLGLIIFLTLA